MATGTTAPPRPASTLLTDACTLKLAEPMLLLKSGDGRNTNPKPATLAASATRIKSPLLICVDPSCLNNVPLVILVILKCVTSAPSAALRVITRPVLLGVSSLVVVPVADGVSATAVTVMTKLCGGGVSLPPAVSVATLGMGAGAF